MGRKQTTVEIRIHPSRALLPNHPHLQLFQSSGCHDSNQGGPSPQRTPAALPRHLHSAQAQQEGGPLRGRGGAGSSSRAVL